MSLGPLTLPITKALRVFSFAFDFFVISPFTLVPYKNNSFLLSPVRVFIAMTGPKRWLSIIHTGRVERVDVGTGGYRQGYRKVANCEKVTLVNSDSSVPKPWVAAL